MQEGSQCPQKEPIQTSSQPVPSLQLLPQPQQQITAETPLQRRDKKPATLPSVNNFIQKTYAILQQKQFQSIVSWSENSNCPVVSGLREADGAEDSNNHFPRDYGMGSFKIHNLRAFQEIVLPKYFKHSNMSSFVRQLNMYNFHKVRGDRNEIEFEHQKFKKNRPDLLHQIRRKQVDSTTSIPSIALLPQAFSQQLLREPDSQPIREVKKQEPAIAALEFQSPVKRESSEVRSFEPEEARRIAQLQEANRSLKKTKQMKLAQLRQLNLQNRNNTIDKFNKLLFAVIATKLEHEFRSQGEDHPLQRSEVNVNNIHKIIDHVMDSSHPETFKQYLALSQYLLGTDDK